jgi:hypothetical protein
MGTREGEDQVTYRRIYTTQNEDGSTTVRSYGPITTGAGKIWHSPFMTGFVLFCAGCLLSPWSAASSATLIWALCFAAVGFTLHVLHPEWIRGARPRQSRQHTRDEFRDELEKVSPKARALFEGEDVKGEHGRRTDSPV